jgi:hypothetical protein
MICVEVYEDKESKSGHAVSWSHVVGVLCLVETEYSKTVNPGQDSPQPGATEAEMEEGGWRSDHPYNWVPGVWPVLADGNADDEYPLRVWHTRDHARNLAQQAVVPCFWPPEQDQENAIRIGKELIEKGGNRSNWTEIPAE